MLASEMIWRSAVYHGPKTVVMFCDQRMTFTEVDLLSPRSQYGTMKQPEAWIIEAACSITSPRRPPY